MHSVLEERRYAFHPVVQFHITCDDYPELIEFMRHDKKSEHGELNFTLLHNGGNAETGCEVDLKQVEAALDSYRDLMHI